MNYQIIYDSIILKASSENRSKVVVYYEAHHIVPKCLGGSNKKCNIVLLTTREHYLCHKILTFIYPNSKGIALALHSMTFTMKNGRKLRLSSRDYEAAREIAKKYSSGENNPRFGKIVSEDTRRKLSEKLKGHKFNIGRLVSSETRAKISVANKGRLLGVKKSDEMRRKLSESNKGRVRNNTGKSIAKLQKPFTATDKNGEIHYFKSGIEMNILHGTNRDSISKCLNGAQKKTLSGWHNFKFQKHV